MSGNASGSKAKPKAKKKKRKYEVVMDGDWIKPYMRNYKMRCCDCNLVHTLNFKVIRERGKNKIMIQVRRDERATAARRRELRKKERKK